LRLPWKEANRLQNGGLHQIPVLPGCALEVKPGKPCQCVTKRQQRPKVSKTNYQLGLLLFLFLLLLYFIVNTFSFKSSATSSKMHISSALVAGTLALQASAFLIPLEISKAVEEAKGQVETLWRQTTETVELDCPNCPFFAPEGTSSAWDEEDENKLVSRAIRIKHASI
jgi:hypothetical protein